MSSVETVEKSKKSKLVAVPVSPEAKEAILAAVNRKDSIYDLELIGVHNRTLSMLDCMAGIITMDQLMSYRPEQLINMIKGIGIVALQQILDKLPEYHKIAEFKKEQQKEPNNRRVLATMIRHSPVAFTIKRKRV